MTYAEKLRDPRWQRKRLEVLQRDNWTCLNCKSKDKTLHVHHRYYIKQYEPWEYPLGAYSTLCEDCHADSESRIERFQVLFKTLFSPEELSFLAETLFRSVTEGNAPSTAIFLAYLEASRNPDYCFQGVDQMLEILTDEKAEYYAEKLRLETGKILGES